MISSLQQHDLLTNNFQEFSGDILNFEEWENSRKNHHEVYMAESRIGYIYDNQKALGRRQLVSAFQWKISMTDDQEITDIVS